MNENADDTSDPQLSASSIREIERLTLLRKPLLNRPVNEASDVVYFMDPKSEETKRHLATLSPLRVTLESVDSLARWADPGLNGQIQSSILFASPVCLSGARTVSVPGIDGIRREAALVHLSSTDQYNSILIAADQPRLQRPFWLWLCSSLSGAVPDGFVQAFKNLVWSAAAKSSGTVDHGKQSYARDIVEEVTGASSFPETVIVNTTVYALREASKRTYPVHCVVDLDCEAKTIRLIPRADMLQAARDAAYADILSTLQSELPEGVALYEGYPKDG